MKLLFLVLSLCFMQQAFAEEASFSYSFDQFHRDHKFQAMKLCEKQILDCKDHESPEYMDLKTAKENYKKFDTASDFDFVFKIDCKDKVKKTITNLCHIKLKPSVNDEGISFAGEIEAFILK